ncbi:membrane-spanning 4-domains subfamily A member 4D-like [Hyla sarda]|uniref:membrane-spanning 4-domains subfamily A member 4D-like n=1 Tax=Hyla sarda TaxID=327740 RepID=UPI0024C28070|nr:membrane-spanning 4-domains subfamily A member 4D-like [Hyla sarda]
MSTLVTDEGGFVIISQTRPQNSENLPEEGQSSQAPARMPKPLDTFYRGEPEVLGTVQIFVGIIFITFGATFTIICEIEACYFMEGVMYTGVLLWSGALFVVSGSLLLSAAIKPTVGKVRSSLVMNIISIAASCITIIIIATVFPTPVYYPTSHLYCAYYKQSTECIGSLNYQASLGGTMMFLFLLTILMLCITISTSVFGCRTACRSAYNEMNVIIYQTMSLKAPVTTTEASLTSTTLLDS